MSLDKFIRDWQSACAVPKKHPGYDIDKLIIENPDGSSTELRGLTLIDIDYGTDAPSTYRRVTKTVVIEGPRALADMKRAMAWAVETGIDMLTDGTSKEAMLFFENEEDAILAIVALT